MFDWLARAFGADHATRSVEVCHAAHSEMDKSEAEMQHLEKCLQEAETKLSMLEEDLQGLKEQGERLCMETHDTLHAPIPPAAQAYVAREVRGSWRDVERRLEAQEDLIIDLQIKRAQLVGEHRKAEVLLGDLGGRRDHLAGIEIGGQPAASAAARGRPMTYARMADEEGDDEELALATSQVHDASPVTTPVVSSAAAPVASLSGVEEAT